MKKLSKISKIIIMIVLLFSLTGCTKILKDENKKVVQNEETGQNLTENILCRPTNEKVINLYNENKVDLSKLPKCDEFKITSGGYEGIWTTLFVKPLAFLIIQLGKLTKNYGVAIILLTLLIRLILYPITKKTAMQSEVMKEAKPELDKLELKYRGKNDQESMMKKSQEMMMIYKKYNISPLSGCLFAFIQIPLFFAFYESLNRLPVLFEGSILGFHLGTSPLKGISTGNYLYIILIVLVALTTYFSFKLNSSMNTSGDQAKQMKMMSNISIVLITFASFTMTTGIELYWIANSGFTVIQNLLVKRGKKNVK